MSNPALLELARAVVEASVPPWGSEAEPSADAANALTVAIDALRDHIDELDLKRWISNSPSDIREIPAWMIERPNDDTHPSWRLRRGVQVEADGRTSATDGHGLIIVDDGVVPERVLAAEGRRPIEKLLDCRMPRRITVDYAQCKRWFEAAVPRRSDKAVVRIGRATLDAELVLLWLMPAVALTEGPIAVEYGGAEDQIRWSADGWTVCLMPMRVEKPAEAPDLVQMDEAGDA